MTVLKEWVPGADEIATAKQHEALRVAFIDVANEKLEDPMEWHDRGAVCVLDTELTEKVFGEFYIEANLSFVRRWFLKNIGNRKEDEKEFKENLPGKILIRVTSTYTGIYVNEWDEKSVNGGKKELIPRVPANDYEMRISMNAEGGACFGVLVCDENHPMFIIRETDYINRVEAQARGLEKKRERLRNKVQAPPPPQPQLEETKSTLYTEET
jgi:hypothetical protein